MAQIASKTDFSRQEFGQMRFKSGATVPIYNVTIPLVHVCVILYGTVYGVWYVYAALFFSVTLSLTF